jgi:hypothetical protein
MGNSPNFEKPRDARDCQSRRELGERLLNDPGENPTHAQSQEDAMARYTGGMHAKGGYYCNPRTWEVHAIPPEGGRLPGAERVWYVKVPFPLLFVVVPVLGALFIVFLPVIACALLARAMVKKLTGGVKKGAAELASTIAPGWHPGEAHFTGRRGEDEPGEAPRDPGFEELEKEIERKKNERK